MYKNDEINSEIVSGKGKVAILVKNAREKLKMGLVEFATHCSEQSGISISHTTISDLERSLVDPTYKTLKAIAPVLNYSPEQLQALIDDRIVDTNVIYTASQIAAIASHLAKPEIPDLIKDLAERVPDDTVYELIVVLTRLLQDRVSRSNQSKK